MAVQEALPRWDLTPFFPAPDSPEVESALDAVARRSPLRCASSSTRAASTPTFDDVIQRLNDLLERFALLEAYLYGEVAVDSRNAAAQARLSELLQESVGLSNLETRITAWLGEVDADELLARSEQARAHEYAIRRAQIRAQHLMSQAEEDLAAELSLSGMTAWGKLHGDLTSQLLVTLELDGEERKLPMSEVRNLASNPDRDVRRRAYEAELEVWEQAAVPLAAALNWVKGATNVLSPAPRTGTRPSTPPCSPTRSTARRSTRCWRRVRESLPDFRRYFRAKAHALGIERLAWYDVFAPLPGDGRGLELRRRARVHRRAVRLLLRADARLRRPRVPRELDRRRAPRGQARRRLLHARAPGRVPHPRATYTPAYDGVSTLAHELGHGYHNINLASRTEIQQRTPMTLAETASIFCETIVREGALREAEGHRPSSSRSSRHRCRRPPACASTSSAAFCSRAGCSEARAKRELSVAELCELMLDAQRETYGDGLDGERLHPYMWAMKPHYYFSSFYNYPYMFGLLFGLGLYARYEERSGGVPGRLRRPALFHRPRRRGRRSRPASGSISASPEFWRASLDVIRADIDRYCASAGE